MVNSLAPCSWRASSRLSATPTAPNPATSTVDPSRTPATASAVVFTCLSITPNSPFEPHCCLVSVAYTRTELGGNRPSSKGRRKMQICSRDAHCLPGGHPGRTPGRRLKQRRHHNDFGDENPSCKVPPPCF